MYYKRKIESKNKEYYIKTKALELKLKELDNLKNEIQIKNNLIREQNLELENKNKQIKEKNLEIENKDKKIEELENQIKNLDKVEKKLVHLEVKKKSYKKEINNLRNENLNIKNNIELFKNMFLFTNQGLNQRTNEHKIEEQPKLVYSNVDVTHNNNLFINSISQKKELNIETSSRKIPLTKIDDTILNHQLKMGSVLGELKTKIGPKYLE